MKINLLISRNSIGNSISAILIILNILHGCTKETPVKPEVITDKNFFFTVDISGKSFTTYRVYSKYYPDLIFTAPDIWGIYMNKGDSTGGLANRDLHIDVLAQRGNGNIQDPGNCSASISLKKTGDLLGIYKVSNSGSFRLRVLW